MKAYQNPRIWIYQSNQKFFARRIRSDTSRSRIGFIEEWTAHGSDLKAGYEIRYKRFIVLALDQTQTSASGCSIDASVHFIQQIGKKI